MAVNGLTYEQSYAFLTDLYEEATGQQSTIQVVDTGTFTSVATAILHTGYDNIIGSISQVLQRTIFSVRPYAARFKGISVDQARWGAIIRKINYCDTGISADDRMNMTDGSAVDPWIIKKPKVLQTNIYGSCEYEKFITIFKDQLDAAFENETKFGNFISGLMTAITNELEAIKEAEARGCLINFMTAKYTADPGNAINVLQAYYDETGTQLTPATMWNPDNFVDFSKWLYAFINDLTDSMAERSEKFHMNVTGKELMRHTPANKLKMYLSSKVMNRIDSTVMSSIFNPDKLKMIDKEAVVFWQNIEDPDAISATPTYMKANGDLETSQSAVTVNHVIGCLFDEEALGIVRESEWMQSTGMNARGGYSNTFYHFRYKTWNDMTENFVLLYADTVNA